VALWQQSIWLAVMAFFLLSQAAVGWRQAQYLKWEAAEAEMKTATDEAPVPEKKVIL